VSLAFASHHGTIYILGEAFGDPNTVRVLGMEPFEFSLPPRGDFEKTTAKVASGPYGQGSDLVRTGYHYGGWYLRIEDGSGKMVLEKASTQGILKSAKEITATAVGKDFDRQP
jgi:hypothetical protein